MRFIHTTTYNRSSVSSVLFCDHYSTNGFLLLRRIDLGPVQIVAHPIYGNGHGFKRTFDIQVLRISNFDFSAFGVHHVRPFDRLVVRVGPIDYLGFRIEINSSYSFFVAQNRQVFLLVRFVTTQFRTVGVNYSQFCVQRFANATEQVAQHETIATRANV